MITVLIILVVFLAISVGVLGYLVYVNYTKAERIARYCEAYVQFISALYIQFYQTREHMKSIDRLGAFQADDEVGVIFKELDQSIDDLHEFITKYVNTADDSKEEEKTKN